MSGGALAGANGVNFTEAVFGPIGLLLINYLVVKVPRIVNPEGAGIIDGFAQMLQMAVTPAATVAAIGAASATGGPGCFDGVGRFRCGRSHWWRRC